MNIATETNHALELMKSQIIVQTGTEARWLKRLSANSVASPCGCRIWTGKTVKSRTGALYPVLTVRLPGVRTPRNRRAHRIAAEIKSGPIPFGYEVDHVCRQTLCVAPAHLSVVPAEVNRALVNRR